MVKECPLKCDGTDCNPEDCANCVEDATHESGARLFDEMPDSDYYGG